MSNNRFNCERPSFVLKEGFIYFSGLIYYGQTSFSVVSPPPLWLNLSRCQEIAQIKIAFGPPTCLGKQELHSKTQISLWPIKEQVCKLTKGVASISYIIQSKKI